MSISIVERIMITITYSWLVAVTTSICCTYYCTYACICAVYVWGGWIYRRLKWSGPFNINLFNKTPSSFSPYFILHGKRTVKPFPTPQINYLSEIYVFFFSLFPLFLSFLYPSEISVIHPVKGTTSGFLKWRWVRRGSGVLVL